MSVDFGCRMFPKHDVGLMTEDPSLRKHSFIGMGGWGGWGGWGGRIRNTSLCLRAR